jgi:histidyl-tRNA synthetase
MALPLQPVRGTHDLLPEELIKHRAVADAAREIALQYGYAEIQPPMFEFSDVFHRTLGDSSDVVTKETYSFTDRGGESITLRPEFTASIARAYLTHNLQHAAPAKFFYYGAAFRYERPQKGRLRQFHQIGAEVMGAADVNADVEMILMASRLLGQLGLLPHVTLEINSLGDSESRARYRDALVTYFEQHREKLSEDSLTRLAKNPLRILDSKAESDRAIVAHAPTLADAFTDAARERFAALTEKLDALGVRYQVSPRLVRGLDYYCHTVFEFTTTALGAQGTVLAGGRYDQLLALMGGSETPSIGWAAGVERLVALREAAAIEVPTLPTPDIAIIPLGEEAEIAAYSLAETLRSDGYRIELAFKGKADKRMKRADKLGAKVALLLGSEELANSTVTLKRLSSGVQETVSRNALQALLPEIIHPSAK